MKLEELKKIRYIIDREIEKMEKNKEAQRKFQAKKKDGNLEQIGIVWEEGKKKEMTLGQFIELYGGNNGVIYYTDGTVGGNVIKRGGFGKLPLVTEAQIFFEPKKVSK